MVYEGFLEYKDRFFNGGLLDKNNNINFIKSSNNKGIHFRPSDKNSLGRVTTEYGEEVKKSALWINNELIIKKIL